MTDRIPLDHLTSDQYDALYERLDQAEAERDELRDEIATAGAKLADMAKSRNEWQWRAGDAERRVRVQRERADRAEAAVDRVRAECDQLHRASVLADDQPHTDRERGIVQAITRIHAALDEPAPATPAATQATEPAAPARPWSTCTVPADHAPHPWHDPWPLPHGQDAHCPGRPTPDPKEQP